MRSEMEIVFPGGARVDAVANGMVITTNQDGTAPAPFGLFLPRSARVLEYMC
jgi:hypothetical protein